MNILFVSALLPYPLHSGGQIRIYNLLKHLSEKHSISLFSFIRSEKEREYADRLSFLSDVTMIYRGKRLRPKYLVSSMIGKYPLLLSSYDNALMRHAIYEALHTKPYDLVHIEPFYVYPSLPERTVPLVVAEHNVEYEVYADYAKRTRMPVYRQALLIEADRIRDWELRVLSGSDAISAVSESDAEKIRHLVPSHSVRVVPNGVDTEFFRFGKRAFGGKPPRFLFVGDFLWLPNRDMLVTLLSSIWPAIRAQLPDAELSVVGKHLPRSVRQTGRDGISFEEHVSDIRDAYGGADALLAPIAIAGGTKFKILEAMASGCAVITTTEGIHGIAGAERYAGIARTATEFADQARSLYTRKHDWQVRCKGARSLVEASYSWPAIAEELSAVWEGVRK